VVTSNTFPFSGAGPVVNQFFLGSEGILGIITEVTLKVQELVRFKALATVSFPDFFMAVNAVRSISQTRLHPTMCRLVDATESLVNGLTKDGKDMLMVGFESANVDNVNSELDVALGICKANGGVWQEDKIEKSKPHEVSSKNEEKENWKNSFFLLPYVWDILTSKGAILDTFETSCTWNAFEMLHTQINNTFHKTIKTMGAKGIITCRFTHVYSDGPAPYFTFIVVGTPQKQLEEWEMIKHTLLNTVLKNGGTVTHHHAVGKDHKPFYLRERDPLFIKALTSLKVTFDPHGIMNPGVLIDYEHIKSKL